VTASSIWSNRSRLRTAALAWGQSLLLAAAAFWVVANGAERINYRWQWYRISDFLIAERDGVLTAGPLLDGLLVTLEISFYSLVLTLILGLATALLRLSLSLVGRALARGYIELIRNTPLLIQLYIMYFVLGPILGWDRITTAVVSLGLFQGAYTAEIIRAGLLALPRGQREACRTLGLTAFDSYRYVILPQVVRNMLPPLTNEAVSLIKNSSIVSVIAIFDLTTVGRNIIADTFLTFEIWLTVAAIYLIFTISLSTLSDTAERRMHADVRR
jgi:polar amino acid transport system permease protein